MRLSTFSPLRSNEEIRNILQMVSTLKARTLDRRGGAYPMTVSVPCKFFFCSLNTSTIQSPNTYIRKK